MINRAVVGVIIGVLLAFGFLGSVGSYFYGRQSATEEAQQRYDKALADHNDQMRRILSNSSQEAAHAKQQLEAADARLNVLMENLPKMYARDKNNVVILDKSGKPVEPYLGSDFSEAWNKIREEYK